MSWALPLSSSCVVLLGIISLPIHSQSLSLSLCTLRSSPVSITVFLFILTFLPSFHFHPPPLFHTSPPQFPCCLLLLSSSSIIVILNPIIFSIFSPSSKSPILPNTFIHFFFFFFLFTSFREQDEAYINSLRWSASNLRTLACKSPALPLCYGRLYSLSISSHFFCNCTLFFPSNCITIHPLPPAPLHH